MRGYVSALKYQFGAALCGRLAAAFATPTAAIDAEAAPYADPYLEYAAGRRVRKREAQGEGCSGGSVHTSTYDVLGRTTAAAETTLGTGVDGVVRRIETAYDTQGNAYLLTNYDAASAGTIVNQVQRAYHGLGQRTREYQATAGAVNTGTTLPVDYAYSEMAGGANYSRLMSLTYSNGRVVSDNYATGLEDIISRLTSLLDTSDPLVSYSYLGLRTVVKRAHPLSGIDQTFIKLAAESVGDAGDQYVGLDRFGRVVDDRWMKTSDSSFTDRFHYGYDRDGNRLFRENGVNSIFSELYHANGSSNGYDLLNQVSGFARGTLSDTNRHGVLDTVASATQSQGWTLDALGNFKTQVTDGTTLTRTANAQN